MIIGIYGWDCVARRYRSIRRGGLNIDLSPITAESNNINIVNYSSGQNFSGFLDVITTPILDHFLAKGSLKSR